MNDINKRVGHHIPSYGFYHAYIHDESGSTLIGSISDQVTLDQLAQFHREMCQLIAERTGQPTREFFGGYYQESLAHYNT